ncbi:MAG TPA: fused MFS/spermidine synthase [Planctomycetota bacterium]|nr:fused MFS/spermidine synthase [Planctomycetota bacterium]
MESPRRSRWLEFGATLFFVLSGACGLVYEVLWFKRFAHVWGSSSLAMASVVASFLAGLGLGAWWLGKRADRMRRPLFAYALCEFGIAVWAVCVPFVTPWCARIAAAATPGLEAHPLALTAVRVATTFVAIAPACFLMGATLPLLVRWLSSGGRGVGRASAWLYAFNAAGAALGAWIAGFHLLPAIGLDGTNFATAATSAAIGAMALALDRSRAAVNTPEEALAPAESRASIEGRELAGAHPPPAAAVQLAALLAGFGALSLQMLWGRELALLVGATTYAFSALIVVFIAGLGAGSLCFALLGRQLGDARRWIALATLLLVVGVKCGHVLAPKLALLVSTFQDQRASEFFNAFLCSWVSAVLELVATFAMGVFFPALIALVATDASRAGTSVGRIYAWNTLGSIVGALSTFTLLVPWIGSHATLGLALACYLAALLLTLAPKWNAHEVELGLAVLVVALIAVPWRSNDPRAMNLGLYLYLPETREALSAERSRVLFFEEGASANVLALEVDATEETPGAPPRIKSLRVNGKVDASNWSDMQMQLGAAYFSLLLRPDARSLLVIGMGSGTTAGAALAFPDTDVTCCELEPAIIEAARVFAPDNKDPHASPRFHAVIDDGRNHVQAHAQSYDLIISEPSNPWIAGISNLYTSEFYSIVRSRLARNGMFVQWVQTYGLSAEQYALIANTALGAFPEAALLRLNENDTLLLCANERIVPERATLDRSEALLAQLTDVREDLTRYFGTGDLRALLLSLLVLDRAGLESLCKAAGDGERNTDANLRLEFNAPRDLFGMRLKQSRRPGEAIYAAFDPRFTARLITDWGWDAAQTHSLRALKLAMVSKRDGPKAFALNELLLAYEPDDLQALADQLVWRAPDDPEEFAAAIQQLVTRSPVEAARVAKAWLEQSQFPRARTVYEALQVSMPDSPTVLAGLALCLVNLAQPDEARALLARARKIDPLDGLVHDLEKSLQEH